MIFLLTPRLNLIINQVQGNSVADIGTDHGFVPIELVKSGKCTKAIATDINKGPAAIAKANIKKEGLSIDVRVGGGLSTLQKGEVEEIIIAGMGGKLISDILSAHMDIAKSARLILQPMNGQYELRKFLIENNFTIEEEDIAIEGFKVYNVLIVKNGEQAPFEKDIYYHLPKYLFGHKNYKKLFEKKKREFTKVVSGLENSKDCDFEKLNLYKSWLKAIEECKL